MPLISKGGSLLNKTTINSKFDLKSSTNPKKFADTAANLAENFTDPKFLPINNVLIYYDPTIFNDNDKAQLGLTLRTRKKVDEDKSTPDAKTWRDTTKQRMVFSEITVYQTATQNKIKPFNCFVTTGAGPNAMGTSHHDITVYFSPNDKELKNYRIFLKLAYRRFFDIQIKHGIEICVLPPFGLGLYISDLDPTRQEQAIAVNYAVLFEVLAELNHSFTEVICVMPDNNGENKYLKFAKDAFRNYQGKNPVTLAITDMLETAQVLAEKGFQVGLLNPGSDRTIGGAYKEISSNKLPAAEETIAQSSNLVQTQAIDIRSKIASDYIYIPFPPELQCPADLTNIINATKNSQMKLTVNLKDTATNLRLWLGKWKNNSQKIVIYPADQNGNYKISFKTEDEAILFTNKLKQEVNIGSKTNPGKTKLAQSEGNFFIVMLTRNDMEQKLLPYLSNIQPKTLPTPQTFWSNESNNNSITPYDDLRLFSVLKKNNGFG